MNFTLESIDPELDKLINKHGSDKNLSKYKDEFYKTVERYSQKAYINTRPIIITKNPMTFGL